MPKNVEMLRLPGFSKHKFPACFPGDQKTQYRCISALFCPTLIPGGESPAGIGLNISPHLTDGAQGRGVTACVS